MSLDRPDNPYAPPQATVADVSVALPQRPRSRIPLLVLLAFTAIWCVGMPFLWAYNLSTLAGVSYFYMLGFYEAELSEAALVTAALAVLPFRPRLAVLGLVAAAVVMSVLKAYLGSASGGTWPVTVVLPVLLAWRVQVRYKRAA